MSNFKLVRRFKLDDYGKDWKGCYLEFEEFTVRETKALAKLEKKDDERLDFIQELLSDKFVEGKAFDGKKKVKVTKDQLEDLPFSIYKDASNFLLV